MIYPNYTHNVKASIKAQLPNFASESPQQIEDSDWFPDIDELVEQAEDHRDEREAYEETIGKTERKMHTLFLHCRERHNECQSTLPRQTPIESN